jgi:hypothetical protein
VLNRNVAVKVASRIEVVTARLAEVSAVVAIALTISMVVTTVTTVVTVRVVLALVMPSAASLRAVSLVGTAMVARSGNVRTVISVPAVAAMCGASPCATRCHQ